VIIRRFRCLHNSLFVVTNASGACHSSSALLLAFDHSSIRIFVFVFVSGQQRIVGNEKYIEVWSERARARGKRSLSLFVFAAC
jgi:hypothetical protein